MEYKNNVEVNIAGKPFTFTADDSPEHIVAVAEYVNGKLEDCAATESYKLLSPDKRNMMLLINMADDYIKSKQKLDEALTSLSERNQELYDIKHDIITMKMKCDTAIKQVEELQNNAAESAARIIRLETELKNKQHK